MKQSNLRVDGIPVLLWGDPSEKVFVYVHGKMGCKENAALFAEIAEKAGWQTLSFDLPEHGERAADHTRRCDVWNGQKDLSAIADYAFGHWEEVSLFGCSLGAWFALQTYSDRPFGQCLFQSPVVDMPWLVGQMMRWWDVTEETLKEKREIETPIDTLRWDAYCYIRTHPIVAWRPPTSILYAGKDNLQPLESIRAFADRFHCAVTVSPDSQHPFMEPGDEAILAAWMKSSLGHREGHGRT